MGKEILSNLLKAWIRLILMGIAKDCGGPLVGDFRFFFELMRIFYLISSMKN